MADTNLFALNELLEKIKAGEGTAKTNLKALNAICILSGGQGGHKTNLDALNEILTVFSPASPSQEKSLAVTENGEYEVIPDEGYSLSKVGVSVDVPSLPQQAKTVTITENSTTEILPDEGYTLSAVTAEVSVASEGGQFFIDPTTFGSGNGYTSIIKADFSHVDFSSIKGLYNAFNSMSRLHEVIWPESVTFSKKMNLSNMFSNCKAIETIDLSPFSFSAGISDMNRFAAIATALVIVTFGTHHTEVKGGFTEVFYNCTKLETCDISALGTSEIIAAADTFYNCKKLKNLIVSENFMASPKISVFVLNSCDALTHDSLIDVISKLATRTDSPVLRLGDTNLAKLTENEIAVATGKGWTLN